MKIGFFAYPYFPIIMSLKIKTIMKEILCNRVYVVFEDGEK